MSNIFKKSVIGSAIALGLLAGAPAMASELTGNVGVVSDYVFRGESQNMDFPAVQGGLDYTADNGFHVGTWISSLNGGNSTTAFGYEMDLYGGYAFTVKNVGMEVGYYTYNYPQGNTANANPSTENKYDFGEYYVSAAYGMFSAKYSYSPDYLGHSKVSADGSKKSAYYIEAAMTYPIKDDLSVAFHVGEKAGAWFDASERKVANGGPGTGGFTDYSVSLTKGEYSFTLSNTDNKKSSVGAQSDNYRVYVGWKHNITL